MKMIDRYIANGLGWEDIAIVLRISKYDERRRDQLRRYVLHEADHAKLRRSKNAAPARPPAPFGKGQLRRAEYLRNIRISTGIG